MQKRHNVVFCMISMLLTKLKKRNGRMFVQKRFGYGMRGEID